MCLVQFLSIFLFPFPFHFHPPSTPLSLLLLPPPPSYLERRCWDVWRVLVLSHSLTFSLPTPLSLHSLPLYPSLPFPPPVPLSCLERRCWNVWRLFARLLNTIYLDLILGVGIIRIHSGFTRDLFSICKEGVNQTLSTCACRAYACKFRRRGVISHISRKLAVLS